MDRKDDAEAAKNAGLQRATAAQLYYYGRLLQTQGKQDQARALWAKIKDADKEGEAGQIAAQKLGGK